MASRHLVALSGGKDSTAMSLLLKEREPREYTYVCTPTGDEFPDMVAHWDHLEVLLGSEIIRLQVDTLDGLIEKQNARPNWRQRWCTRILKLEPFEKVLVALSQQGPVTSYVGLRADEPDRPGGVFADMPGVTHRKPLREWGMGEADVWAELERFGVQIPKRTDCRRCFFQRLPEWYDFFLSDRAGWMEAEAQEEATGHTFRSPGRDSWPAALKDLRREFEGGRVPKGWGQGDLLKAAQCRVCSL
jgi:PP-loop superfamily ATP-utilizing enzyme